VGTTTTESCFTLGVQFPFQQKMMLEYGRDNVIAMDATFGTNALEVRASVYSSISVHAGQSQPSPYFMEIAAGIACPAHTVSNF